MLCAFRSQSSCLRLTQSHGSLPLNKCKFIFSFQQRFMSHNIWEPIEEELFPSHRLASFHQTHPGEILDGKYKTIVKLGYGTSSTVCQRWRKSSKPRYVSVKISARDTDATWEAKVSERILNADPSDESLGFLRTPIDKFNLSGPDGSHSCLVYPPMRETLCQLQSRLRRQRFAPPLFKFIIYCLLNGLDYLHTKCHIIHTDIKDDNIMVTIEKDEVLADFVKHHKKSTAPRHTRTDGRTTYLSQGNFGSLRGSKLLPQLGDFNLAFPELEDREEYLSPIQSHRFRAPEVLLGCPWSYGADIWNFGLLMWNLLEDVSLFGRPAGHSGEYDAHVHLAQMVNLLGNPPQELIDRERFFRDYKLKNPVTNTQGKKCQTMNELWGGPFFDAHGQIFRHDLVKEEPKNRLAETVTEMTGDEKEEFLDFASGMLQWLPEKRKSARELLQHPIFDSLRKSHEDY